MRVFRALGQGVTVLVHRPEGSSSEMVYRGRVLQLEGGYLNAMEMFGPVRGVRVRAKKKVM